MVTKNRSRRPAQLPLFIAEWMKARGVSDEALANALGVARETVTRYRGEQHRLNPLKIAAIAHALDLEPEQLWRPPSRQSVDAILRDASDETVAQAAEVAAILVKRGR